MLPGLPLLLPSGGALLLLLSGVVLLKQLQ